MGLVKIETSNVVAGVINAIAYPAGGIPRILGLLDAVSDGGVSLTATASGTTFGISRTAGTSLVLSGVATATAGTATASKAAWSFVLPDTYTPGAAIPVSVVSEITGGGTLTIASCTMAVAAFLEGAGTETALTVTGGTQQMVAAGTTQSWTIAGAGLVAGSNITVELTMAILSSITPNTGVVQAVTFNA